MRRAADPAPGDLVLLVAHHLIVDEVSWRVLIGDFEALLRSPDPLALRLPLKSTSLRAWSERLLE